MRILLDLRNIIEEHNPAVKRDLPVGRNAGK